MSRAEKILWGLVAFVVALTLLGSIVFVFGTVTTRLPYWGEAEVVFEASRIHDGYKLFISPLVGAQEYGPPPSRYFVTYPPILAALLSLTPKSTTLLFSRFISISAWFGGLVWLVYGAKHRKQAVLAAGFVAGIWVVTNFAMVGRPDSLACLLAMIGLSRGLKRGGLDRLAILCLLLVPWIKPTILGLPFIAILVDAIHRKRLDLVGFAVSVTLGIAGAFWLLTKGNLFDHIISSNAQPMTASAWLAAVPSRLPFFLPLFAFAAWHGRKNLLGLGALVGAFLWTIIALAKTGSAANYWMEPCVAAVALLAHEEARTDVRQAVIALAGVIYTASASIPAGLEHLKSYRAEATFIATIPARCGGVIASDEPGIELALNNRILTPAYQMSWLVTANKFPADTWAADLRHTSCYVLRGGIIEHAVLIDRAVHNLFTESEKTNELTLLKRKADR